MNRRLLSFVAVALLAGCAVRDTRPTSPESASRPNVLLIITDDQGYGDFGFTGNPHLKTPHLDRLAAEGIWFDRFFASPVCSPTRAALLTGRYPLRTGVWGVTHGKETMRSEEVTLAEALRGAGYRTGLFGKWHNGEHFPYTPQGQGFDEFFGFHNGHWNNYFDTTLERNGRAVKTKGYITDVLTDAALKFIEQNRKRPFFCYVPYNAPHSPFQVPDKYFERFKALGMDDTTACVYGMCENIDDNIGRLLARLDELKLADNTIVVFLTDNGPNTARYNAGMRGRKGSVREGGVRVPLLVRWPARFSEPRKIDTIAAHIDVLPTILELCDVPRPEGRALDGRSLAPLMTGESSDWPERVLFTHRFRGGGPVEMFPGAARIRRYRLVNEGKGYELYDLRADPGETIDIASANPDIVQRLRQEYERWFADVTREPLVRMAIPVGHTEENPVVLPAPQAYLSGGVRFKGVNGYANDWVTDWTNLAAKASWELDVVKAGTYEVQLGYLCPKANAGSTVRISVGDENLTAKVAGTPVRQLPSPDRVPRRGEVFEMEWAALKAGRLELARGSARLTVEAIAKADGAVMELKHVSLKRVP